MVNLNKIRCLENHILPDHPEFAGFHITNQQEKSLIHKAQTIRQRLNPEIQGSIEYSKMTFEQQSIQLENLYNKLNPQEKIILTKESNFMKQRLFNLLIEYFKPLFPKNSLQELFLHISWFLSEMEKLAFKESVVESEWNHNRNEDDPDFDDFAWWEDIDKKMSKTFPDGIFTENSLQKLREWLDNKTSQYIREYWKKNPDEYEELMGKLRDTNHKNSLI